MQTFICEFEIEIEKMKSYFELILNLHLNLHTYRGSLTNEILFDSKIMNKTLAKLYLALK